MRLIDAEELFSKVGDIKPTNSQQYHDITDFMNMITNQPTIKVIPIEVLQELKAEIEDFDNVEYDFIGYYKAIDDVCDLIDRKISEVEE